MTSHELEKQTLQMERKLQQIKNRKHAEDLENSERAKQSDGSNWKSGMQNRGSLYGYSRDVKDRQRKVSTERRSQPKKQQPTRPQQAMSMSLSAQKTSFQTKPAARWEISDVLTWLASLGLTQYGKQFADNEIAGTILLDIGLDDLDYMGIKVLAHRKKLLKGIEELKRNGKVGNNPPPPPGDSSSSSSSNNNVGAKAKAESQPQHWSNVKPMSENKVENNDVYDEQAEAAAFKNAVMEWRSGTTNGQTANTIEPKEGEWTIGVSKGVMEQQQQVISDGGVFSFGGGRGSDYTDLLGGDHDLLNGGGGDGSAPNELTEAEDAAAFKAAVMDWRSGGTKTHENDAKDAGGGGGALLQGSYDEAAEGEAFKKAVADFRNPNPSSNSTSNSTSGGAGADTAPADSQTVAANLAKRMELEFEEKKEAMKTKRREAEEALKERLRNKEQELTEMYANKENIGEFDFDEEEYRRAESKNDDDHDEEEEEEEKEERNTISFQSPSKTIGVQLLGTEMWSPEAKDAENTGCVIEEESSDEE